MIGDFHFLRPEWLLGLVAAGALLWIVARREDLRARWKGAIAPHLLDHLLLGRRAGQRLRPVHHAAALIALGSLAASGPTWERDRPPFVSDKAPLVIAIDLGRTMDAVDITPTRLERAKLKVGDLLALRKGAKTAIYAYAGSAHMVLPLTDDAGLIKTYVDSLATSIMPIPGKDTAKALKAVEAGLASEDTPGTILFMTDGVEDGAVEAFRAHAGNNEVMVLGIGTPEGGPVRAGKDGFANDATGRRLFAHFDVDGLKKLKGAGVQVATVTQDDADVQWIQRRVQTHLQQKEADEKSRWKDEGWWLVIPITLLGALWFRRGWTIRWASVLLMGLGVSLLAPQRAQAAGFSFVDLFLTHDQQGRIAYQRGDFAAAAEHFQDAMWRGAALYRAGRFAEAVESFARVDSAESDFNQGDALARLGKYEAAVARYQAALQRRPDWPEAKANLEIVRRLVPKDKPDDQGEEGPNIKPDEVKFDEKGKKGKKGQVELGRQTAEMWMRNIQTTPTELLARKFAIQAKGPAK